MTRSLPGGRMRVRHGPLALRPWKRWLPLSWRRSPWWNGSTTAASKVRGGCAGDEMSDHYLTCDFLDFRRLSVDNTLVYVLCGWHVAIGVAEAAATRLLALLQGEPASKGTSVTPPP